MGVRAERKAATRQDIQAAALDLIESGGLDATTVAQIAERAGISERTFFRYCDSKEAAVLPGQGELIEALVARELGRSMSPAQILQELVDACREQFAHEMEHYEFLQISRLVLREPRILQMIRRQELELVTVLSNSLMERKLLDRMQALLVAEVVACTWRVAWQCFAYEQDAGADVDPADLFERAVAGLSLLTSPVSQ